MSNQTSQIRVTTKNLRNKSNRFFLQSSSLFLRASVSSQLNKESMIWPQKPYERQFVLLSLINAFVADNQLAFTVILVKRVLLEIGFTEEMETTWGNEKVLQTFSTILFIRKKI